MLATDYSVSFSEQSDTMSLVSTWLLYQTFEIRQSRQIRFDSFISNVQICGQYRFSRPARDERLDSFRSTWYAGFQWFFRSQTFQYVIVEGGKNTNEQIFFQSMPPLSTVPTVTRTHHHTTFHRVLTTLCRHNRGANSLRSWMHACMQYVERQPYNKSGIFSTTNSASSVHTVVTTRQQSRHWGLQIMSHAIQQYAQHMYGRVTTAHSKLTTAIYPLDLINEKHRHIRRPRFKSIPSRVVRTILYIE